MKPIVGVMPLWDEERESIWMLPGYMDGIKLAGGIPVILPLCEDEETIAQFAAMCDGFLFTGGQDVSPEMYHENALDCVVSFEARDRMEAIVLMKAIEADCREESHFLWAVQWHPEFSFRTDENSMKIFRAFVTAMEQAGTLSA